MPFKYTSDHDRIIFTRLGGGCGRFLFIFTGILFTACGAGLIAWSNSPKDLVLLFKILLPLFGIGAIIMGIRMDSILKQYTPDTIIFDNANGRVEITQETSEIVKAYMYYDEISGFNVSTKSHTSSSSGSRTGSSIRTYYTWHVYLTKKDGGQWELLKFNSSDAAEKEIAKLTSLVQLSRTPKRVPVQSQSISKFDIRKGVTCSEITWRNKNGQGPLFLFLFSVVFIAIAYTIGGSFDEFGDIPIFAYVVAGFIGSVFIFVIGGTAFKMFKNSRTEYHTLITREDLKYQEKSFTGALRKEIAVPLKDMHAVSFTFDTDKTLRKLYIYTHEQFRMKDQLPVSVSIDSIKTMYKYYTGLLSLDMPNLTAVEALYVENFLQKDIQEKSKSNIL